MTDSRQAAAAGPEGRRPDGDGSSRAPKRHTRWLYVRVLVVQAATLLGLWLLQAAFGS